MRFERVVELLKTACVALGATATCFLWLLSPLIVPGHTAIYHWSGSPSVLFLAPLLDFCVAWLAAMLALVLLRTADRVRGALCCGATALAPWVVLMNWAYLKNVRVPNWISVMLVAGALLAFLFPLVFRGPAVERKIEELLRFSSTLMIFAGIFGGVTLCEAAWFGWQARRVNVELPLHRSVHSGAASARRPRVLWIVFDELSYRQVYEHRSPKLELPTFDALAGEATVFTHVVPAGILTERVLPSLISGQRVDAIRVSPDGSHLSLHNQETHHPTTQNPGMAAWLQLDEHDTAWRQFDEHDTVFQDALNLNYSTAVAGWFNPYCRILPDVLDRCFWSDDIPVKNTMTPDGNLGSNLIEPLKRLAGSPLADGFRPLLPRIPANREVDARRHISDLVALEDAADRILEDKGVGFALIHLPVPHGLGIYDRRRGAFTLESSDYLDNLALADKVLAHMRWKLEQSGQWDSSTIVMMGDHSWRTTMGWRDSPDWTREEEEASDGGCFDDRPFYVVKMADQRVGVRNDAAFAAVNTRKLFDVLLSQRVRSADELSAWVNHAGGQ